MTIVSNGLPGRGVRPLCTYEDRTHDPKQALSEHMQSTLKMNPAAVNMQESLTYFSVNKCFEMVPVQYES